MLGKGRKEVNVWVMYMINDVTRKIEKKKKKKRGKESVLVVLAQNLFYNWCLFYINISSEI